MASVTAKRYMVREALYATVSLVKFIIGRVPCEHDSLCGEPELEGRADGWLAERLMENP